MAANIAPDRNERAHQYRRTNYRLDVIGYGLTLLYPVLLAAGGSRWLSGMIGSSVLFVGVLILGRGAFQLPVAYARYRHKRRFGVSDLSAGAWIGENLPYFALGLAGQGALALLLLLLWQGAPTTWYLWVTAVAVAVLVLVSLAAPWLVHGWITESTPLPDGELKERLVALSQKAGFPVSAVYVSNAEPGLTTWGGGWVSGFGASRRITLDGETVGACTPDEIEAMMGHELGHCVYNHSVKALLNDAGAAALVFLVAGFALEPLSALLGLGGLTREALPLLVLLLIGLFLIVWPLRYALMRKQERDADAYALRLTGKPEAFISGIGREAGGGEPPRWVYYYRYRHPATSERIAAAAAFARRQEEQWLRERQKTLPHIVPEGFWYWRR